MSADALVAIAKKLAADAAVLVAQSENSAPQSVVDEVTATLTSIDDAVVAAIVPPTQAPAAPAAPTAPVVA